MTPLIVALIVLAVVVGYIVFCVKAGRAGRLNFKGRREESRPLDFSGAGEFLGGCVGALFALAAMLAGLFAFIWLIKAMWNAA